MERAQTYFNEIEAYPATWLTNLYPEAVVEQRDVRELQGSELERYRRVHLFAGIGGWEYALRLARWPAYKQVWTGSCPCQPFSAAGKGLGEEDPRHLWPEFRRLIAERHPPTIFGEQVESKAGREWLARVFVDLEALGYAVAGADLCAAGAGAPHIRQRLFWVAFSEADGRQHGEALRRSHEQGILSGRMGSESGSHNLAHGLANAGGGRRYGGPSDTRRGAERGAAASGAGSCSHGGLGDAHDGGKGPFGGFSAGKGPERPRGAWDDFDLVPCRDGKTRRIEPGSSPLAHGVPNRVGRLRAYGNSIVPQVAALFIRSFLDITITSPEMK